MQNVEENQLGFRFIDDTNIITWGDSAQDNCTRLEEAHNKCMDWSRRHGSKFAPDKYKLMHFTRRKRDPTGDLASTIKFEGSTEEIKPESKLRVLGVWLDPKLNWQEHTKIAVGKGTAAFKALSRIAATTWGPCMRRTRLLYTAVVRPAIVYGAHTWHTSANGKHTKMNLQKLENVQNKCLRRITGGYKRTPRAALEREARVQPLDLYLDALIMNKALEDRGRTVIEEIQRTVNKIWESGNSPPQHTQQRGGGQREPRQRPPTACEQVLKKATERDLEIRGYRAWQAEREEREGPRRRRKPRRNRAPQIRPPGQRKKEKSTIDEWADLEWKRRWRKTARNRRATTWQTPWEQDTLKLYSDMPKHQASALFLLRTEVLGLNGWLASINVPGISPSCGCGWPTQTVQHVLMVCPLHTANRADLVRSTGTEDMRRMLSTPEMAQATARWFVQQGILQQFNLANEIDEEEVGNHAPFQPLEAEQDFP
jgi:hypothetical protein